MMCLRLANKANMEVYNFLQVETCASVFNSVNVDESYAIIRTPNILNRKNKNSIPMVIQFI